MESFGSQIEDIYYSKYPSFAPREEIEENIKEIIKAYTSLLNSQNSETIREIIMDEIDRVVFVSKPTHLWNLEMEKNLGKINSQQINLGVVKAVDALLMYLSNYSLDCLEIGIGDKRFSLREQLLARWKKLFSRLDTGRVVGGINGINRNSNISCSLIFKTELSLVLFTFLAWSFIHLLLNFYFTQLQLFLMFQ